MTSTVDSGAPAPRVSLKRHIAAAARILNDGPQPLGLMGERLSKAVATIAGCAMHDPALHFTGLSFDGVLGREEWLAPYSDASDVTRRVRLIPEDTWITRWAPGQTHQAPFRPLAKNGPVAIYIHSGALQVSDGFSVDGEKPPMAGRMVLTAGSRFEATKPGTWLALCPLVETTMTVIGMKPSYDLVTTHARVLQQTLVCFIARSIADNLK